MWYIQGFDRRTDELAQEAPLTQINSDAIRRVLDVYDDLPVEPFDFDVPTPDKARELATFSDTPLAIDPDRWYQLAFYAD